MIGLYILCAVIAYVIGSISFSEIFAKAFKKQDITKIGSGNAGTTNMLRAFGWKLGLLTLVCDLLKGVAAVLIAGAIAGELAMYIACVFAVVGHKWSCFMKFKGGKGIATTTGVLLVVMPIPTIIIFVVCVLIVVATKIMSIGSIIGVIASAVMPFIVAPGNLPLQLAGLIICAIVLWAHRDNIKRLANGTENKLSLHKKKEDNADNKEENA